MKVLFHSKQLNYRGVTNSVVDYAHYNQEILGNESAIIYNPIDPEGLDTGSKPEVIRSLRNRFEILTYDNNNDLNRKAEKFDLVYTQKAGHKDDLNITSTKWAVHCVFQYFDPHGDVYAYISEWLATTMTGPPDVITVPLFVPYIVQMPPNLTVLKDIIRDGLGIPRDAFVIGRHGGFETFDIPWVIDALPALCDRFPNLYILLMNTRQVVNHPRIIYLSPVWGGEEKTCFIAACDAGLHARTLGESFGLGICEFLFHNKPILAWEDGFDRNHVELLRKLNLLYNQQNFQEKISQTMNSVAIGIDDSCHQIVDPYTSAKVMQKFKQVFID